MRLNVCLSEAARNMLCGTARAGVFGLVAMSVIGAGVLGVWTDVSSELARAARFTAGGGSTSVLQAKGRVIGRACDDLVGSELVRAAGGLRRSAHDVTVRSLAGAPVPLYEVTPGFARLLTASTVGRGVLMGPEAAATFGLHAGDYAGLADGSRMRVSAVYRFPDDGRQGDLRYAVLSVNTSRGRFDQCWVDSRNAIRNLSSFVLPVLSAPKASSADLPKLSQLNSAFGSAAPSASDYRNRPTVYFGALYVIFGLFLGFAYVWRRRLQFSQMIHSGVKLESLFVIVAAECTTWVVLSLIAPTSMAWMLASYSERADRSGVFGVMSSIPLSAGVAIGLGAIGCLAWTRASSLVRLFRDR
jgi:hypothetical protein